MMVIHGNLIPAVAASYEQSNAQTGPYAPMGDAWARVSSAKTVKPTGTALRAFSAGAMRVFQKSPKSVLLYQTVPTIP